MALEIIEGTATALSPIIHGGDSRGTMMELRRVKMVVDGRIELIPVISGNSIRGILRDACAEFSLRAAGINRLSDLRVFHLLFGGGALVSAGEESYIDIREERTLRELLPALSLFGGSVGNRVLGGRVDVGEWVPICRETKERLPEAYAVKADTLSIYDLVDMISFTRRDDAKNRRMQDWLEEDALFLYQKAKETKHKANEAEEPGQAQQMRYTFECFAPGTVFYVEFTLHHVTDIELGTFLGGLALFATRPHVGGRASTGLGKVRLDLKQVRFGEPVRLVSEIAQEKVELARRHLAERKEEIQCLLQGLA